MLTRHNSSECYLKCETCPHMQLELIILPAIVVNHQVYSSETICYAYSLHAYYLIKYGMTVMVPILNYIACLQVR